MIRYGLVDVARVVRLLYLHLSLPFLLLLLLLFSFSSSFISFFLSLRHSHSLFPSSSPNLSFSCPSLHTASPWHWAIPSAPTTNSIVLSLSLCQSLSVWPDRLLPLPSYTQAQESCSKKSPAQQLLTLCLSCPPFLRTQTLTSSSNSY